MPLYLAYEAAASNTGFHQYIRAIANAINISQYKDARIFEEALSIAAWFFTVVNHGIPLNNKDTRVGLEENIKAIQRIVGKFEAMVKRLEKLAIRNLKKFLNQDENKTFKYEKLYNFWLAIKQFFAEILKWLKSNLEAVLLKVHHGYPQENARQDVAKVFLSAKEFAQLL